MSATVTMSALEMYRAITPWVDQMKAARSWLEERRVKRQEENWLSV